MRYNTDKQARRASRAQFTGRLHICVTGVDTTPRHRSHHPLLRADLLFCDPGSVEPFICASRLTARALWISLFLSSILRACGVRRP